MRGQNEDGKRKEKDQLPITIRGSLKWRMWLCKFSRSRARIGD